MRYMRSKLAAVTAAVVLAACGGGGGEVGTTRTGFSSLVSFGDSLSDVGTYRVGAVAALGGGQFTVNGAAPTNWTEDLARSIGAAAPCAAETGLLSNIPQIPGAPVAEHAGCTNYAQGSSRVHEIFAPNSATLQAAPFSQFNIGLMAKPVDQQIAAFLAAHNGAFAGTELVTVLAGGNDIFMNLNGVSTAAAGGATAVGGAIAAGWDAATQNAVAAGGAGAVQAAATAAVTSMGVAGATLAGLIKAQIVGKGAKYVVVVNLPDVSQTPMALSLDATTQGLINQMVTTFNSQLSAGLNGTAGVVYVDAYTQGHDQVANPAQYALTNVTTPACATNALAGSSLVCNSTNVAANSSNYLYADSVHPTPFGHQLLAQFVAVQMAKAGWL